MANRIVIKKEKEEDMVLIKKEKEVFNNHKVAPFGFPLNSNKAMSGGAMIVNFVHTVKEKLNDALDVSETSGIIAEKKAKCLVSYYGTLIPDDKAVFLKTLASQYSVDHSVVLHLAKSLEAAHDRGTNTMLRAQERLRQSLVPRYHQLFTQISRLDGGVKFLVDLRADIVNMLITKNGDKEIPHLHTMNTCLREMLSLWFSVGFMQLERITWESPCDILQKISEYEAVHPIRNWTDLKRRVGPYRRCFVFTHSSMPREPVVVLHTALTDQISSSIQSIVQHPRLATPPASSPSSSEDSRSPTPVEKESLGDINTAIFYSITSTQRGLGGVELGNYLIKSVVQELKTEIPHMSQFSSLSPIPGFKDWLVTELNRQIHAYSNGEEPLSVLLLESECKNLKEVFGSGHSNTAVYESLKRAIQNNAWFQNKDQIYALETPLSRLCSRYLYLEKHRGFALNPVANFHLRNGAMLWRINWLADTSPRGLGVACGFMVNYRYYLDQTEENSKQYLQMRSIAVSPEVLKLVRTCPQYEASEHSPQNTSATSS